MSVKSKMQALKKELLLKEASLLFEETGYQQMKVADLAKIAGVSIGTIYGFFDSKEGLYQAYISYQIEIFTQKIKKRTDGLDTTQGKLRVFIEMKFLNYMEKAEALNHSVKNNPFYFSLFYKENAHPFHEIFLLQAECFKSINKDLDDNSAMELTYLFNGFTDGYVSRWFDVHDDLMAKTDKALEHFISIAKGYK